MSKICTKCNNKKPYNEYGSDKTKKDGLNYWCKKCVSEHYINNKEKKKLYSYNYVQNNKDKHSLLMEKWYKHNKLTHQSNMSEWVINNPDYHSQYFQLNKKERYEYKKQKYHNDINYRLKIKIRDRIQKSLKNNSKSTKTTELLGCSILYYKLYLESKFKPEMNWDNHGEVWEIDHIIPCSSFDLTDTEQQKQCFVYTNTQPLFKTTQISESFGYTEIGNKNKLDKII